MEATENRNRTATRNDSAFETLMKKIDLGRIEFFYQFCNNPECREVTALILPLNRKVTPIEKKVFSSIARQARIPAIILEYPDQNSKTLTMYGVASKELTECTVTWNEVLGLLARRQLAHEQASTDKECANYTHAFLPKGTWNNKSQNYRFSNEVRSIPGVRHCDTDGVLYCLDCCAPIFVVEATSDGCPGTHLADKHKATNMTKRIAQTLGAYPVLLQHHVGDKKHEHPAYLTSWGLGERNREEYSWTAVAHWFDMKAAANHTC